ncbi:MAG: hypothetical protein M1827_002238 [Pycnora praestabilis]|nr:MAG: hypothetical protein M1827_002238 [Pycnora praestabilis]
MAATEEPVIQKLLQTYHRHTVLYPLAEALYHQAEKKALFVEMMHHDLDSMRARPQALDDEEAVTQYQKAFCILMQSEHGRIGAINIYMERVLGLGTGFEKLENVWGQKGAPNRRFFKNISANNMAIFFPKIVERHPQICEDLIRQCDVDKHNDFLQLTSFAAKKLQSNIPIENTYGEILKSDVELNELYHRIQTLKSEYENINEMEGSNARLSQETSTLTKLQSSLKLCFTYLKEEQRELLKSGTDGLSKMTVEEIVRDRAKGSLMTELLSEGKSTEKRIHATGNSSGTKMYGDNNDEETPKDSNQQGGFTPDNALKITKKRYARNASEAASHRARKPRHRWAKHIKARPIHDQASGAGSADTGRGQEDCSMSRLYYHPDFRSRSPAAPPQYAPRNRSRSRESLEYSPSPRPRRSSHSPQYSPHSLPPNSPPFLNPRRRHYHYDTATPYHSRFHSSGMVSPPPQAHLKREESFNEHFNYERGAPVAKALDTFKEGGDFWRPYMR